jgi:uncharacterized lipoprotein YddW (UPF0748 family)
MHDYCRQGAVLTNNYGERWDNFRCGLITSMVKELAEEARSIKPDIKINVTCSTMAGK